MTLDMMKEESQGLRHFKIRETKKPGMKNPSKTEDVNFNNVKSSNMDIRDVFYRKLYIRRGNI